MGKGYTVCGWKIGKSLSDPTDASANALAHASADSRPTVGSVLADASVVCRWCVDPHVGRRFGGIGFLTFTEKSSIVQNLQEKIYKSIIKMSFADVFCSLAKLKKRKKETKNG